MTTRATWTALALLLVGCKPFEARTGIQIQLTADDPDEIRDNVDRLYLIIDPEEPFTDAAGDEYVEETELSSSTTLTNWLDDDDALELVYELSAGSSGPLPLVELAQGRNQSAFTVRAEGWLEDTWTVSSEIEGPLQFKKDTVPTHNLAVGLLDVAITPCLNGEDDDGDGWTDADDPDCSAGDQERGTRETLPCNDGEDNDGDGFIDADDPECVTATTTSESDPCSDGEDNDADGYTDDDDPDCATGDEELGFGDTECNDGVDNDGDGDTDVDDAHCADAFDDMELIDPCLNGEDDDLDGWTDDDDPDCRNDGVYERNATSAYACNDGVDNDGDGDTDVDDAGCTSGTDDAEANACEDGVDNDADGWTDLADPGCSAPLDDTEGGFGSSPCNDGVDNDGDGAIDRADPDCEDADFYTEADQCSDTYDNDGDGWADRDDPDCASGTEEVGYGTTECNDGVDNDGDGDTDDDDAACDDANDD